MTRQQQLKIAALAEAAILDIFQSPPDDIGLEVAKVIAKLYSAWEVSLLTRVTAEELTKEFMELTEEQKLNFLTKVSEEENSGC